MLRQTVTKSDVVPLFARTRIGILVSSTKSNLIYDLLIELCYKMKRKAMEGLNAASLHIFRISLKNFRQKAKLS